MSPNQQPSPSATATQERFVLSAGRFRLVSLIQKLTDNGTSGVLSRDIFSSGADQLHNNKVSLSCVLTRLKGEGILISQGRTLTTRWSLSKACKKRGFVERTIKCAPQDEGITLQRHLHHLLRVMIWIEPRDADKIITLDLLYNMLNSAGVETKRERLSVDICRLKSLGMIISVSTGRYKLSKRAREPYKITKGCRRTKSIIALENLVESLSVATPDPEPVEQERAESSDSVEKEKVPSTSPPSIMHIEREGTTIRVEVPEETMLKFLAGKLGLDDTVTSSEKQATEVHAPSKPTERGNGVINGASSELALLEAEFRNLKRRLEEKQAEGRTTRERLTKEEKTLTGLESENRIMLETVLRAWKSSGRDIEDIDNVVPCQQRIVERLEKDAERLENEATKLARQMDRLQAEQEAFKVTTTTL